MKRFIVAAAMTAFATASQADEVVFKEIGISAGVTSADFQLMSDGVPMEIKGQHSSFYNTFSVSCEQLTSGGKGFADALAFIVNALPMDIYTVEEAPRVIATAVIAADKGAKECVKPRLDL